MSAGARGKTANPSVVSYICAPGDQIWKNAAFTTAQTGAALWTPAAGKKIAITHLVFSWSEYLTGKAIIWFGGAADTTYTAGTDQLVMVASLFVDAAPTASLSPTIVLAPSVPIYCATADFILRLTTTTATDCDVAMYGYEF
jgi:hypothetical protein